jgi:HK97 family phage portal protein
MFLDKPIAVFKDTVNRLISHKDFRSDDLAQIINIFQAGNSYAGVPIDEVTSYRQATAFACKRLISGTLASFPLIVYERLPDGGKREAFEHPLHDLLLNAPNPNMTADTFIQNAICQEFDYGNEYAFIEWDKKGQVEALWPLPGGATTMMASAGSFDPLNQDPEGYYYVSILSKNPIIPLSVNLLPPEVLHVPFFPTMHQWIGWSKQMTELCGGPMGLGLAEDEQTMAYYKNGMTFGDIIEMDREFKDDAEMKRMLNILKKGKVGPFNAWKPTFLPPGMKISKSNSTLQESQNVEHRRFQVEEICRLFQVPAHLINAEKASAKANVEQQNLEFAEYNLLPHCKKYEQETTNRCFVGRERGRYFVEFDIDELLRADFDTRQKGLAVQRQNGIINANEWRRAEGLDPIDDPDMNAYLVLSNMGGIGNQANANTVQNQLEDKTQDEEGDEEDRSWSILEPVFTDVISRICTKEERYIRELATKGECRDMKVFYEKLVTPNIGTFLEAPVKSLLRFANDEDSADELIKDIESRYDKNFKSRSAMFILKEEYNMQSAQRELMEIIRSKLEKRGVIGFHHYPLADADQSWDASAATKDSEPEDLKKQCAWFDSGSPDLKGSYKLPHHMGKADGYKTVWKGVAAAYASVKGSHGNKPAIPSGDIAGVKAHLKKHYEEFGKDFPEE